MVKNISKVLKVPENEIDKNNQLKNLGIGSLMGMELFNRLKNDFKITLPLSKILKGPSINEITEDILVFIKEKYSNNLKININQDLEKNDKLIPLSFPQQRLWFIEQLESGIISYNIPSALKFDGYLNYEILEKSINKIIERHENLRTVFKLDNNIPHQVILSELKISLKIVEIDENTNLNEVLKDDASIPFDLKTPPLLRGTIFRKNDTENIVLLTIHHIIADGFSLKILFEEITSIYKELLEKQGNEFTLFSKVEKLTHQYSDFSFWQKNLIESNKLDKQIDFWKKQLFEISESLNLPFDKPRNKTQTFNGAMNNFEIPFYILNKLQELGKQKGVTVFSILLSVYNILIYKYSGQKDIIVGTPITGRNEPEWENLIGLFLNMLSLRTKIDSEISFSKLIEEVSNTTLSAYDNQDLPFEKIVEIINPERTTGRTPIFQTIIALHASIDIEPINDTKITYLDVDMKTSKFDLVLSIIPFDEKLKCVFEYNTDLFFDSTIEKLKNSFLNIIDIILANNEIKIKDIDVLSENEKNKILAFSHGKKVSYDNNLDLLDIFKNQVLSYPNNTAIKDNNFNRDITITYNDLDLESNKIANFLIDKNIKNSLVSVFFERSSELIISILGILKSDNYFLPIDPKNPKKRNELIIEDSQTEIIITSKEYSNLLSDNDKYIFIEDITDSKFLNKVASAHYLNSKTAYVIYTSGSTGIPKGVEISKQNLLNLINWHKETYQLNEKTNSSLIAGVSFDASVWEIFPYIMSGSTIHIPEKNILEKTSSFTNWIEENKIDISFIPTPFFEIINEEDWKTVKSLKKVLVGGDKLSKIPENVSFNLYNHYGPTENTVVSTSIEIRKNNSLLNEIETSKILLNKGALVPCPSAPCLSDNSISIGKPIDNVDVFILDTDLNLCPINITGEIYLTGESISKGYYKKENLNDNYFIKTDFSDKRLYKTGDLAKWNEKGEIIFIGRNNTQVKIRGVRIEIEEVENILNSHEQVKKAVVRIIEKNNNKFLVAYVLTKKEIDLANYLIERLPDAFIPKIIYIEDFYLTTNGKIDFEALEKKYLTNEINIIEIENITPIQKVLIDIFSVFFENTNININSSFFELGGHSLLAIQTVDKISRAFNINLEIKDLFSYPNINNLSKIIELKQKNGEFKLPEIIQNNYDLYKPFPLTEIQQAYLVGRENIELGNISAHGYIEIEIKDLDIDKFEKAFNKVIARHYLLKTVIENDKQVILKNVPYFKIKTYKINSNNSDINNINEILEIRKRLSHEKIDYSKFPVFNLEISVLNEEISILHYSFDAIFTDATSIIIIAKEITDFYNNTNLELQNLEINFRDYVLYCEKLKDSFLYNKSKNYWLERLENLPSAPQLYTNISKINENINKTKFNRLEGKLSKDKWDKIKLKAKNLNITVNTILITSFSKILSYWSKKSDFTLNITLFNRLQVHRDINNILGDFTSLNLLEINLDNSKNLYENSINIQKQLIEDIDNRYFGGVSVLRELARLKGLEASFMPVVFTSMVGNNGFDFNSLLGKIVYSITQTPQVWLDHQVAEINDELVFNWDYLEHIFPEKMIKAMFEAYCNLLEEISEQNLDNYFNISDKKQIDFINLDFNNTYKKLDDKLLHEGFFEQVEKNPNKIAIISDNEEFTYNDIFKLVKNTAYKIQNSKKDDSKFIGVYLDKSYKQVVAVLSILYLGYAYIPLNIDYPKDRNDFIINTCNIKTIISDINYDNNFNIVKIDKNSNFIYFKNEIKLNSDETAYIIFTSGSTGIPKGVEISHKGAVNTILDINERFNITSDDSIFALSSLSFDLSVYDIFGTFFAGGTIVIPSNEELKEPSFWENLLIKNKVTIWNSVPALMNMYTEYCNDKKERFSSYLKTVMMSGDWIPLDLPNKIKAFDNKIKVISLGGATEASIWSIFYEIESFNNNWNSIPYGKPLSNQKMYVLNDSLEICPEYIDGYIYIGGEGLAKSYYNDEEKTNKSFVIHPQTKERLYKTGDLGRFLPEGYIEFLGREDHQVKINGYRIEIGEIETFLIKHEKISNVIVITSKDKYNKKLIAYLEIKENLDDSEIISYLSKKLPEYMIPKIFVKLEKFPLSDNGKIDRKQLPDYINYLNKENIVIDSKLSNKILKIIKEVLNIQEIYNDTDLLSIGTNSIDIVKIANRLEVEFGFCPKISDIFRLKTVNLISDFYEKRKNEIKETFEYKEGQIIIDVDEREKFRNNRLSIRKLSGIETKLDSYENNDNYNNYKTTRFFSDEIINKKDFGNFLGVLREIELNSSFKYLYPSAGSLYPVQIYILMKENAVQDFSSGIYYYNAKNHSLIKITDELPENIHFSYSLNIYNSSKFSIFLISDLRSIEPLYSTASIEYSYIEAGSITQLLRSESYKYNIGLCSIGQVNDDNLKKVLNLDDKYLFLHTILGGIISNDNKVINNGEDDEWEEIVI
ncbi:MAG: amino acid adenylation domain-containing protein [Cyanobacteriota bacterium]